VLVQHLTNTAEQLDLQIHLVIFVAAQDNTADPRATCDREEAHDPGRRFRWYSTTWMPVVMSCPSSPPIRWCAARRRRSDFASMRRWEADRGRLDSHSTTDSCGKRWKPETTSCWSPDDRRVAEALAGPTAGLMQKVSRSRRLSPSA
jgi:hypothetical protein